MANDVEIIFCKTVNVLYWPKSSLPNRIYQLLKRIYILGKRTFWLNIFMVTWISCLLTDLVNKSRDQIQLFKHNLKATGSMKKCFGQKVFVGCVRSHMFVNLILAFNSTSKSREGPVRIFERNTLIFPGTLRN